MADHHPGTVAELTAVGVRRYSTGQVILDGVDWTVRAGEHWALLGPNGAGNMRELRAAIGFVSPAQKVPADATAHTVVLTGATGTVQPLWGKYGAADRGRGSSSPAP